MSAPKKLPLPRKNEDVPDVSKPASFAIPTGDWLRLGPHGTTPGGGDARSNETPPPERSREELENVQQLLRAFKEPKSVRESARPAPPSTAPVPPSLQDVVAPQDASGGPARPRAFKTDPSVRIVRRRRGKMGILVGTLMAAVLALAAYFRLHEQSKTVVEPPPPDTTVTAPRAASAGSAMTSPLPAPSAHPPVQDVTAQPRHAAPPSQRTEKGTPTTSGRKPLTPATPLVESPPNPPAPAVAPRPENDSSSLPHAHALKGNNDP